MKLELDVAFKLGEKVVLAVAEDVEGIINAIQVHPYGVIYRLAWVHNGEYKEAWVEELELERTKNVSSNQG